MAKTYYADDRPTGTEIPIGYVHTVCDGQVI